ncbi:MAG: hypothetical protein GF411_18880 [Candidatus Lokiarchaeota archaeon]|nr:hypothetical protein [Candidatus Lokiarchaeota archaeon]
MFKNKLNDALNVINEDRKTLRNQMRQTVNHELAELVSGIYFKIIPLDNIFAVLNKYDIIPLQEDNTKFAGFLAGDDGRVSIDIAPESSAKYRPDMNEPYYAPYDNSNLYLVWHKMDESGRYEIVTYLT